MPIATFIEYNFAPIIGLIFQILILVFGKNFSRSDRRALYLAIVLESFELITYNIEFIFAQGNTWVYARTLFSVLGYIVRPLLVYPFIILIRNYGRRKKSKLDYLDLIPFGILVIFELIALEPTNHLVFYYTESNNFVRGPLGFISQIITIWYLLEVTIQICISRQSDRQLNTFLLVVVFLYCTFAMIFESIFDIKSLGVSACIFSVVFFMFALQTNHLNATSKQLKFLSETDSLSKLNNRYYGEKLINNLIDNKIYGMFAILDIDKFKQINDTFGHNVGDEAIIKVAEALKNTLEKDDIIMRLGGDEFAVFSTHVTSENVLEPVQKLFNEIKKIELSADPNYKINISVGLCEFKKDDVTSFDKLYKIADDKLYESKTHEGDYVTL